MELRKIVFRGKSERNGVWLYGDLEYNIQKDIARIHTYNKAGMYECQYIVDNETVGQFSGLYDKNGKEIYEGDILRWGVDNRLYVVTFEKGMFFASAKECNDEILGGFPLHLLTISEVGECVIVGNIYDNRELLKS